LSAIQWPRLAGEMRLLGDGFLAAYEDAAGSGFAGDPASIAAHTACLMLARTDGLSPAQFLDEGARRRARLAAVVVFRAPERGVWASL